jgi:hypothetical protein
MDSSHKTAPSNMYSLSDCTRRTSNSFKAENKTAHSSTSDVTPRTAPLSIRNLSHHDKDTDADSGLGLKHMGFPMLTIRRTSQGATSTGSLAQLSSLHHHRRSMTESSPTCAMKFTQNCVDENSSPTHPPDLDESAIHDGSGSEGEAEICARHHHRQFSSSTVSIACSDHEDVMCSLAIEHDQIDSDFDASIIIEPLAPSMLIPLINRPKEVADLLEHNANKPWTKMVQNTLGMEVYEKECLPLWVESGRKAMPDLQWLRRSKQLLTGGGCDGIVDEGLWNEFCGMVGWDCSDISLDEQGMVTRRRASCESFKSNGSGKMSSIAEEEEELEELSNQVVAQAL